MRNFTIKVLEGLGVALICLVFSGGLIWLRGRINAKVQADQTTAASLLKIADDLTALIKDVKAR